MNFFKPSDIRTVDCVVNSVTRAGAAFAMTEGGDSVFIPNRFVEQYSLDTGDFLTCYCIDQSLEENRRDENVSAKYRAVRMKSVQRLVDAVGIDRVPAPAATPAPQPSALPLMPTSMIKEKVFYILRAEDKAWSSRDLADLIAFRFKDQFTIPEEIGQKVSALLHAEHDEGNVSACAIRKSRDQKQPSALYYSMTTDTLIDLMEGYGASNG